MLNTIRASQNFQLLTDFTCATAKDELKKHPEMRTIAMVELENNFPSEFSREVLKCLPEDVAKVIINPHTHVNLNISLILPKQSMTIYVADKLKLDQIFQYLRSNFDVNFPIVHHLSKHLIVSSIRDSLQHIFLTLLNVVQIFKENQKVIARSFDMTRNLPTFETFESSQRENLSQILFPGKTKNLNGQEIHVVWSDFTPAIKFFSFLEIVTERLNASLKFTEISLIRTTYEEYSREEMRAIQKMINEGKLDFYPNYPQGKFQLESYNYASWCFLVPLPKPYSITELILFLPMDKSCWMWLGITIAVSTLIWRISEGHWSFPFGAFSYFMGQCQLIVRIRSSRLILRILLQLLIFMLFIFSNGYQSLVTSFMLNPVEEKLLKSVDDLLESDYKIAFVEFFDRLHENDPKYQKAKQQGRVVEFNGIDEDWTEKMIESHLAYIQPCEHNKNRIKTQGDGKSWRGLYILSDVAFNGIHDLFIRPFHPYLDKFQELMDRMLENGLHSTWERKFYKLWTQKFGERQKNEEETTILDFGLIAPFFLILVFGFSSAILALLCEIFCKDFVAELTREYFKRKFEEIFGNEIRVERRRINRVRTRRIQVHPVH